VWRIIATKGGGVDLRSIDETFHKITGHHITKKVMTLGLVLLLVLIWLSTSLYTVKAGEVGLVRFFGRMVERDTSPGLHVKLPYPFEAVDRRKVREIRSVEIGYRLMPKDMETTLGGRINDPTIVDTTLLGRARFDVALRYDESLILTGDENILNIRFSTHYTVKDPVHFIYDVKDSDRLVKNTTEASVREIVATRDLDYVKTIGRKDIEREITLRVQELLDNYESGIEVISVFLQYVHAPDEVHYTFRDIASALEDKYTTINLAYGYEVSTLAKAHGESAKNITQAEAYKDERINSSLGEADRFMGQLWGYHRGKEVTRTRLYFEGVETALKDVGLFIKPPDGSVKELNLLFYSEGRGGMVTNPFEQGYAEALKKAQ